MAKMKVFISPKAAEDLQDIRTYITQALDSAQAANNVLRKIMKRVRLLAEYPLMGASLSAVVGIETAYRYLVCGNYLAFYEVEDKGVYIVRVLYAKRDYLQILFS